MTYYLASLNDALFVIDQPPHPSTDDGPINHQDGPSIVIPCGTDAEYADRVLSALNSNRSET